MRWASAAHDGNIIGKGEGDQTDLRLREGQEEEEDGSSLPVEWDPGKREEKNVYVSVWRMMGCGED